MESDQHVVNLHPKMNRRKLIRQQGCARSSAAGPSIPGRISRKFVVKRQVKSQVLLAIFLSLLWSILISDLISNSNLTSNGQNVRVWASWIGEMPTAAEIYGDASAEMPSAEAFDDDEDDEELDASATNEYPDNENDNDNDENYEDAEDANDNAESRKAELWLRPDRTRTDAGHAVWSDLEGPAWRRNKRDLEDRIVLASRRAAQKRKADEAASQEDPDFVVDDGDEDAWVHDGIDDIHIDPETKRAASELSHDERSIDAEYEPKEQLANRTRITTISEVIPMNMDGQSGDEQGSPSNDRESSKVIQHYLPASHLSIDTVQRLMAAKSPAIKVSSEGGDADQDEVSRRFYDTDGSSRNEFDGDF